LCEKLDYEYGGNLEDGENRNINEEVLGEYLEGRGYEPEVARRAIGQLLDAATLAEGEKLYETNRKFYELLRYGVKVKKDVGEHTETVWPIDWGSAESNRFVVAE
jgi:type I restriction enzyme R subunit